MAVHSYMIHVMLVKIWNHIVTDFQNEQSMLIIIYKNWIMSETANLFIRLYIMQRKFIKILQTYIYVLWVRSSKQQDHQKSEKGLTLELIYFLSSPNSKQNNGRRDPLQRPELNNLTTTALRVESVPSVTYRENSGVVSRRERPRRKVKVDGGGHAVRQDLLLTIGHVGDRPRNLPVLDLQCGETQDATTR